MVIIQVDAVGGQVHFQLFAVAVEGSLVDALENAFLGVVLCIEGDNIDQGILSGGLYECVIILVDESPPAHVEYGGISVLPGNQYLHFICFIRLTPEKELRVAHFGGAL